MIKDSDKQHMQYALELAAKGRYTTRPNPCVGCVFVKKGQRIAKGWHQVAGESHAEIIALQQAGHHAKDATVYLTLEPCAHRGKTPPCCEALVKASIGRVVMTMKDPNPDVAGRGIEYLRHHGIPVETGLFKKEAHCLNRGFIKRMLMGLPYVTLKQGVTLDGKISDKHGNSQWITSEASRLDVQTLRAKQSAIICGINTVLLDNPRLTVRAWPKDFPIQLQSKFQQPLRVVVDSHLRLPASAQVLNQPGKIIVYTLDQNEVKKSKLISHTVEIVVAKPNAAKKVDLHFVLQDLAKREINDVLIEAGSMLSGALLEENLVDELVFYIAPKLLGQHAKNSVSFNQLRLLNNCRRFKFQQVKHLEEDIKLVATRLKKVV